MTNIQRFLLLVITLISCVGYSQRKSLNAEVAAAPIIIDGQLTEPIWQTAQVATNFLEFYPDNGKLCDPTMQTEVRVAYDNEAIYIAAKMYDSDPSKILTQLTQRDDFGTADHFGVFINGYNDGQQDFRFFVSAAGVQMDANTTNSNGEDFTWDAIWESKVAITEFGWVAEFRIPYAAIRFPKAAEQKWGINFYREVRRDRRQFTWNLIDTKVNNELAQTGILDGIKNINPPTRLFFIPYGSFYYEKNKGQQDTRFKGGMDIKYGINDSFTLDAILVPDFGQTKFDNVELNLGPFEQQFNENRPFFTEGVDLFNKGDLLYSRRIGGEPSTYPLTRDNEIVSKYPSTVNLINALKLSGRTKGGLGIGILNAVTEKSFATLRDTINNIDRKVVVEPLANYNVLVLDQRFGSNNSISLINTSVTRNAAFRDANVTAALFDLHTKKNTYAAGGNFKYSYINELPGNNNYDGFTGGLNLDETSGNYRYGISGGYISKYFDNNDLGINFQTDYHAASAYWNYRILNPTKHFNRLQLNMRVYTELQNKTGRAQEAYYVGSIDLTDKKNDSYGGGVTITPFEIYDFYEPRVDGRFLALPKQYRANAYISTNYNRKFAFDINVNYEITDQKDRNIAGIRVSPQYRISDHIFIDYEFYFQHLNNDVGYVAQDFNDIVMATRNRNTYVHTISGRYSINNRMTIDLAARQYWSYVQNSRFQNLNDDGSLSPSLYNKDRNTSYNSWNVDLSYSWWFAPGSQISVLYRNNALVSQRNLSSIDRNYRRNLNDLFVGNLDSVISVSIRYYIDYNRIKNLF